MSDIAFLKMIPIQVVRDVRKTLGLETFSDKVSVVVGHIKTRVVKAKKTIENLFVSDEEPPLNRGKNFLVDFCIV